MQTVDNSNSEMNRKKTTKLKRARTLISNPESMTDKFYRSSKKTLSELPMGWRNSNLNCKKSRKKKPKFS